MVILFTIWFLYLKKRKKNVHQIELFNHLLRIILISYLKPYNCWTDRVSSMGQTELFNHVLRIILISYLKPYNCWTDRVSSMGQIELFNHLQKIIIIRYLKPYNCWTDRVSSMGQIKLFNHLLRIIIISSGRRSSAPTPRCSSFWKESLWVTLDYGRQHKKTLLLVIWTIHMGVNYLYYIVIVDKWKGVMVKVLDHGIKVSEFEHQSGYYVHSRTNLIKKGMNLLYPSFELNDITTVLLQDGFDIK